MDTKDLYFFLSKKIEYLNRKRKNYFRIGKRNFYFFAYQKWTLEEIQRKIIDHPNQSVITLLENFRDDLDDFACIALTPEANEQFSTAYDICTDILDMVIVGDRRRIK